MIDLFEIYQVCGYPAPRRVCEVGVNAPDKCSLTRFIDGGIPAILVEPLPWLAAELRTRFPKAQVLEAAIGSSSGPVKLYDRGEGSWIEHVPAGSAPDEHPLHSSMCRKTFDTEFVRTVESIEFQMIDTGDIDVLAVDTEGAEWFAIQKMTSRPYLVRLETHFLNSGWRNPYLEEIGGHLAALGYRLLVEDISDSLWGIPCTQ